MGGTARILIVDDDRALLDLFNRILTSAGYSTTVADTGQRALELLEGQSFEAIVSDLSMPGMDGVQLLQAIRKHDVDVPVLFVTGAPSLDTALAAIEHGAMRYLTKPVAREQLRDAVALAVRECALARAKRGALAQVGGLPHLADLSELGNDFDQALKRLWLAYQPIVSWSQRRVVAYEALLRSRHEALNNPLAVLEAAERLGRLAELGREIRHAAAESATAMKRDQLLFVNLHPHDLADDLLFNDDAPLTRISKQVVLEITERALLHDVHDVRSRVAELRKLGYRVAVDDLGAGYAGLSSVAQLEPEVVKLDMTLVRDLHKERTKQKVVRAVCDLGREMNIQVIAEGVETQDERDALLDVGCDLLQGYYFARPAEPFPHVAVLHAA